MCRTRFVVLALLAIALALPWAATPAFATGTGTGTGTGILNDSEEPGSVLVFHKFLRGTVPEVAVEEDEEGVLQLVIVNRPRTELEISVTCPKGLTCNRDQVDPLTGQLQFQRVLLKAHWVCPGRTVNPTCAETDFILQTTVNGSLYINPENIEPSNARVGEPPTGCDKGYLILWVIDGAGNPIKFDALIGDGIIRQVSRVEGGDTEVDPETAATLSSGSAYNALPIQAAHALTTGQGTDRDGDDSLDFDGNEYQAITGKIFGTVRYPDPREISVVNNNGETVTVETARTDLTLLTLDVKSNRFNNPTSVDLNFYSDDERLTSTNTKFFCWTEVSLTDINSGLTLANMGRKGLVESTAADKEAFLGVTDDTGPVTLVGIVDTIEGLFLRTDADLDGITELVAVIKGFAYSLYHDSEPLETCFAPAGGDCTNATPPPNNEEPPPNGNSTITFDNLNPGQTLHGEYPAGVIDWGADVWYLSGPFGQFSTNSISFNGSGPTSASFMFVSPKVLTSVQAFNGGSADSVVSINCSGNPTVSVTVSAGQLVTINTGWSNACSTVTVGSSNGWDTNFDNVTFQ